MKFRSGREADIRVTTTAGHIAIVGNEWQDLPEVLHQAAILAGCEVDTSTKQAKELKPAASKDAVDQRTEAEQVKDAIKALLVTNDGDDFTVDGIPKVAAVTREAGFTATKNDVMGAWGELQAELNPGDAE